VKFQETSTSPRSSRRQTWKKKAPLFPGNTQRHREKTALNEFSNPRSSGIIAINLEKDDELIGAHLTDGKQMIFLASHDGRRTCSARPKCARWGAPRRIWNGPCQGRLPRGNGARATRLRNYQEGIEADTQNLDELENEVIKQSLTS